MSRRYSRARALSVGGVFVLACGIVLGAFGAPPPLGPPAAQAAEPGCADGWREMPLPAGAFTQSLHAVVTHDGRPAWLLGGTHVAGELLLRWRNGGWRRVPAGFSGTRGLNGGAALTAKRLLAVGYGVRSRAPVADVAVLATPRRIRTLRVPRGDYESSSLSDVAVIRRDRAWAVGSRLQAGRTRASAFRWNGSSWKRDEPSTGGRESGLTAVAATPRGDQVWAVGWSERASGHRRPVIRRRQASGWRPVPSAPLPGGDAVLTDVHLSARDKGWITGYLVRDGASRHEALLLRWDGSRWSRVPLPWSDDDSMILRSVAADGQGTLWLAGTTLAGGPRETRGFLASRHDGRWTVRSLDVPADVPSELTALAATRNGAIAVGRVGFSSLALESCPIAVAGSRRLIAVSRIRDRRRAPSREDLEEPGAGGAAAGRFEVGAALPAPVEPSGFRVVDMAEAAGIAEHTKTWSGLAADLDGDGWQDIFFSRHLKLRPRLYLGGSGGFTAVATDAFSISDRHGCDAADVDGDGAWDVFCAVGRARGTSTGRHELDRRVAHGDADLPLGALGAADPFGRGVHAALLRLDDDAYPELFVINRPARVDGLPGPNRFYRNRDGRFVSAPEVGLDTSSGGVCLHAGDVDGDGDDDIAICRPWPRDGRPAGLRLLRNEGGRLRDRTHSRGIRPMNDIDVAFADVTGDGRRDLIQLSRDRLRVSRWTSSGYRRIFQTSVRKAWALAAGDVDGDGRADLYVLRGDDKANQPDRLLIGRRRGREWRSVRIPQAHRGSADDVFALDYDRNGRADFVILNGRNTPGPVQLLATFPD